MSGGKADLLPTNFGHVSNSSENNEEEYEDLTEEEIIIGEVTYSDEPMRSSPELQHSFLSFPFLFVRKTQNILQFLQKFLARISGNFLVSRVFPTQQ